MQSTKCSCSRFRGCGRNGKNNIQTIKFKLRFSTPLTWHPISIWAFGPVGTVTELQRVQVNQCQFCVLKPKKIFALPSAFLVVCSCSLFSTCLDCFMIFAPYRHECVTVVIKRFCPLCFILSCLDILKWKGFLIKPTVCSILMIDVTIDERIVNTTLNA